MATLPMATPLLVVFNRFQVSDLQQINSMLIFERNRRMAQREDKFRPGNPPKGQGAGRVLPLHFIRRDADQCDGHIGKRHRSMSL